MALPHPHGNPRCSPGTVHLRRAVHVTGALLTITMLATMLTGCGEEKAATATPASASPSLSASPSTSPTPTPPPDRDGDGVPDPSDTYPDDPKNTPQQPPINLECDTGNDWNALLTVQPGKDGRPDFSEVWAAKPTSCDAQAEVYPVTDTENAALKMSKYDDTHITTLYEMCAAVDPKDVYLEAGFAASSEQIPEINAALLLCPTYPYAKKWRETVKRGQVDADLEAQGRIFGEGTFRVGKEIKPGTYVTTDVDGCYWERQNSSGDTIANYFTHSARRVQVTIHSSDYAFSSENCGEWRPAR
ncbi:hypothetical protein JOD64_000373 [Micromonospora luteifusca]|uniref:Septum formation-related domain-containing protein n=1 Tax=Micromonospora luteifusca TaxID=709860 RepID=A0ABS2LLU2_9ACTN|nr:hypothetical protein [Micromonospora luteifusca]MBM7489151.1 hypothetical protein [Micromonospora luteifusca]